MTRVVDVSNSASFEDVAVVKFFEASTRNLLAKEAAAGVRHHVALSVVGTGAPVRKRENITAKASRRRADDQRGSESLLS
jgi:hypothetical protein